MSLFRTKDLEAMLAQTKVQEKGLKRTLGAGNLVALGIGAIIGAGLFVRTAAAAGQAAGPAVTLSFIIAAIGCAFAGLCYAEFAAMIPIAGSAYAYSYVTMGEMIAWIIGWALIMEYALGAATVSIAWSEYLNKLLGGQIPYEWSHSPFEALYQVKGAAIQQVLEKFPEWTNKVTQGVLTVSSTDIGVVNEKSPVLVDLFAKSAQGIMNIPALIILLLLTLLLIRGTQESALVNAVIVFIKVAIVLIFIVVGWQFINANNHDPYMIPKGVAGHEGFFTYGWGGVLRGASIVFFAFIGFDAVSTAAQEAKNPARDMPIGILGSLVVCTILYILFGHVLTGVSPYRDFTDPTKGQEASVAYAISTYMTGYGWLAKAVTIAILAGFSSVILVMLMGQSRIFYTMSNDGLIPKAFGDLHQKYKTPYKANWILFVFVGLFAAFVPGHVAGDLTSFGTLFAFVLVSLGVWIMRRKAPNMVRPFKTPWVPVVPILGALVCTGMIGAIDIRTLKFALIWMLIGLVVYFAYSRKKSKLENPGEILPKASDFN